MRLLSLSLCLLVMLGVPLSAQDKEEMIPGVGKVGPATKLHTGFKFTEGPAADRDGNVYFSDIPNERIHKVDTRGKLTTFREKTNKANGLMVAASGEIYACEMAGQLVAYSADGKKRRVLADKYKDKRFNAPNDLVIDSSGGVYFTMKVVRGKTPAQVLKELVLGSRDVRQTYALHRLVSAVERTATFGDWAQFLAVGGAVGVAREPRVVGHLGDAEHLAQLAELAVVGGGHDEVVVGGGQGLVGEDAGVRVAHPVRDNPAGHVGRGLVDHGRQGAGQQVGLDVLALAGLVAVVQRGQDADGRVQPGEHVEAALFLRI